uniref:Uncharacterized protein n=1 Tax=Setaria viridis TaxID=4556 RepID=A0A4U6VG51_SETVI|nr:hypothetical protein SEVIR_3G319303v2 [Setaria viridis]
MSKKLQEQLLGNRQLPNLFVAYELTSQLVFRYDVHRSSMCKPIFYY